jgi:4-hydroxybenzoate polyprenyltransferase
VNRVVQNIGGFISVSRVPNLIILAIAQVLAAWILLDRHIESLLNLKFIALIFSTQMIAAGGYIINDYYDQKIDMINRPKKVVVGVLLRRRMAILGHLLLNFFALGIGFWIDPLIGLIHVFSAFVLWIYSNHLRRMPLIGNLSISMLSGLIFLIVSVYFRQESNQVMVYSLFAFTITLIREIIKDIEDVKGESAYGCETLPVIWGIRGAKIAIYLSALGGVLLLILFLSNVQSWPLTIYFIALGPFFILFLIRLVQADTQQEFAYLHKGCNLIILSGIGSIFLLL